MENIKLERAKQILEVWKQANQFPDVAEIMIEALKMFITEEEMRDQQAKEQAQVDSLEGVETTMSKVNAEILNDTPQ